MNKWWHPPYSVTPFETGQTQKCESQGARENISPQCLPDGAEQSPALRHLQPGDKVRNIYFL